MITKKQLKQKTKEYLKLNHIDKITDETEQLDIMWWIVENYLTEEEQIIITYKLLFYGEEPNKDDTLKLFGVTRHKFSGLYTKISKKIRQIWEQL